jgi:hypothetical protein
VSAPAQQLPPDAAVVAAYQSQTDALRAQVAALVAAAWDGLGSWRDSNVGPFLKDAVPLVLAGQRQMLSLTLGYLAAQRVAALGRSIPVAVNAAAVTGAAARNGVDPADVYRRPFSLVWRQLADLPRVPGAVEQAIDAGRKRLEQTVLTDLQLTKVQASQRVAEQDRAIVGYQRVLEGPHSCALCIVASTQRYHRVRRLDVHPGCDCSVRPIYGDEDPGQLLDPTRLADVHDRIEQRFGVSNSAARGIPSRGLPDYRNVLITHDHGELGPVLGVRGQPFTGPDDLAA